MGALGAPRFYGGDADGDSCSINFFYKADINSVPSLLASNLRETDLSFTWKTNNSLAQITSLGEITAYLDKTGLDISSYNVVQETEVKYQKSTTSPRKKKTVADNVFNYKLDFSNL